MFKYTIALLLSASLLTAQTATDQVAQNVQVGTVYKIGTPENNAYEHINFPRPNFIIKKGGIANYKRAQGKKVVVTAVKEKKDGTIKVTFKREDGSRFFGSHTYISADFKEAIASGELQTE